jgi:hypothetical protein
MALTAMTRAKMAAPARNRTLASLAIGFPYGFRDDHDGDDLVDDLGHLGA